MKRKAKTNTKAEPGFIKRRNRLNGQFRAHLIEMLESPAWRVLLLSERRVIDRIEIELARHGGNDNGKLPVTYEDFVEYGVSRRLVAPAMRVVEALGFIRVTEHGRGGNAEYRQPNKFFLTFARGRDSRAQPPTDDWRKIKTIEEAEMIATEARSHQSAYAVARGKRCSKKQNTDATQYQVSMPPSGTERTAPPMPLSGVTGSVHLLGLLSRYGVRDVGAKPSQIEPDERGRSDGLMGYVASVIREQTGRPHRTHEPIKCQ
jgi:hypothetical protein